MQCRSGRHQVFEPVAGTRAEVRSFCQDVLQINRVDDAAETAGVVDAWSAAEARSTATSGSYAAWPLAATALLPSVPAAFWQRMRSDVRNHLHA